MAPSVQETVIKPREASQEKAQPLSCERCLGKERPSPMSRCVLVSMPERNHEPRRPGFLECLRHLVAPSYVETQWIHWSLQETKAQGNSLWAKCDSQPCSLDQGGLGSRSFPLCPRTVCPLSAPIRICQVLRAVWPVQSHRKRKKRQRDDPRETCFKHSLSIQNGKFNDLYSFEFSLFGIFRLPKWLKMALVSPTLPLVFLDYTYTHIHTCVHTHTRSRDICTLLVRGATIFK